MVGAIFFGVREFAVSPMLVTTLETPQYKRRRLEIEGNVGSHPFGRLTWSEMRMTNLLDSSISGALTGGIIHSYNRGPAYFLSGASRVGVICAALQLGFNELRVQRVKFASRNAEKTRYPASPEPKPMEPKKSLFERFLRVLGGRTLSDEEYLEILKRKREGALRRIAELEEERSKASEQDSPPSPEASQTS
ncbi:hypothetical protein BDY19DRAFT_961833 [Irpex rosettiformis]|uniref:Uncharacterized protein n=1 Tax=Irpex rosettiformis TaxID=378272 RepID=A0ACB8TW17_9APHY|nr:hypothetical protein BDY19DRAFT_961833 [Irpex rosettiformis]